MMSSFATTIMQSRYSHTLPGGRLETWREIAHRVATSVMGAVDAPKALTAEIEIAIAERKFLPGGRYLYASGRPLHQTQNCLLLRPDDTREGWGDHMRNVTLASMTGAGIGGEYSALRETGARLGRGGGYASGPLALMQMVNEAGRGARQGGARRGAIWAGLKWSHPDAMAFITAKNWSPEVRSLKAVDFNFPATLDFTNISVGLDDEFFDAYHAHDHPKHITAHEVYWTAVRQAMETGEPGFSIDVGVNAGEDLRNACNEVSSHDDSDICNLGSINLARITCLSEMRRITEIATAFLLAGTVYSDVPYAKVAEVRERNRRLGLGLLGVHEWLAMRRKPYAPDTHLGVYLELYRDESTRAAAEYSATWGLSRPVKTRAIAPTGTIGIVAETTTGIEPIFCAAYKRRYRDGASGWNYQLVVDPTARRLVDDGVNPDDIEDAQALAESVETRVALQAWVQRYVDHGISSTINLPAWGSPTNNADRVRPFGEMLLRYLPELRGITVYPDGARGGQPLSRVSFREALAHEGEVFHESADICDITRGESCGA
jgi:ribonucleoside-diphosphate reductase alpha chain